MQIGLQQCFLPGVFLSLYSVIVLSHSCQVQNEFEYQNDYTHLKYNKYALTAVIFDLMPCQNVFTS